MDDTKGFSDINDANEDLTSKLHPVINQILASRGFLNSSSIISFLKPKLYHLNSPFYFKNMETAVSRVREAVDKKQKIGIFADSDLDGITSLTLLMSLFDKYQIYPYYRYLKNDETYGITNDIINDFIQQKIDLLITVDSGIRDMDAINYAVKSGIDVIITDHHEQDISLPDAIIINPKLNGSIYPFRDLAGVGVAFKLLHGILLSYHQHYMKQIFLLTREKNGIYSYSFLYNWTLKVSTEIHDIEQFMASIPTESVLVLCDIDSSHIPAQSQNKKINTVELKSLIDNSDSSSDIISWAGEKFDLYENNFNSKISFYSELFFAIHYNSSKKTRLLFEDILPLVAVGTIADIMPLKDENRILVHNGLKFLETTRHPGLATLIEGKPVTAKTVSWEIAPLLNSPGRFGRTSLTVDFFIDKEISRIRKTLSEIREINEQRRELISSVYSEIKESILVGGYSDYTNITVIKSESIPDGVAGLIANRVMDISDKPVIVVALTGKQDLIKGSGRAAAGVDFFSYITPFTEQFEKLGGHPQAFGFTIDPKSLDSVLSQIDNSMSEFKIPVLLKQYDAELNFDDINDNLMEQIRLLEPFGHGNEEPVFYTEAACINEFSFLGKGERHGRFSFKGCGFRAVGWDLGKKMESLYRQNEKINILYSLEYNIFRDYKNIQLRLIDINFSQCL